jgi:hypothetical protein
MRTGTEQELFSNSAGENDLQTLMVVVVGTGLGREVRADRDAAKAALCKGADARAADIAPVIAELRAAGATSLRAIAAGLNEKGIPTSRGSGEWSAVQVARVLERSAASDSSR